MQKLAEICIKRPVFATMLILMLVVLGLDAYRKLGVDLFPKVEFPIVTITTTLRGASPEEVESQLSKRLEEAVNTVSGIDELQSMSAEGLSRVIITFVLDKDAEIAAQEVRDKVSTILGQLPQDADPPVVEKLATDASPIINVVVSANRDLREITKLVDDSIKKDIETLNGVGQVRFIGERERQIQIWLDGQKMYAYNLNVDQVRGSIAAQNIEVPGGRLDQGNRELSVRTLGRILKPADFGDLIVANNGTPIHIRDIGRVEDGYKETRSSARLDSKEAVVLQIRKQAGTNTLDIIDRIKERIEELRPTLPKDLQIAYVGDQSGFIKASFEAVQEHLILGGLLAGSREAPGKLMEINGKTYKEYRGMGSHEAMRKGSAARYGHSANGKFSKVAAEGIEALKEVSGTVDQVLGTLAGGIQSGLGYLGAANLAEHRQRARYIRVTPAGQREAAPHDVIEIKAGS